MDGGSWAVIEWYDFPIVAIAAAMCVGALVIMTRHTTLVENYNPDKIADDKNKNKDNGSKAKMSAIDDDKAGVDPNKFIHFMPSALACLLVVYGGGRIFYNFSADSIRAVSIVVSVSALFWLLIAFFQSHVDGAERRVRKIDHRWHVQKVGNGVAEAGEGISRTDRRVKQFSEQIKAAMVEVNKELGNDSEKKEKIHKILEKIKLQ